MLLLLAVSAFAVLRLTLGARSCDGGDCVQAWVAQPRPNAHAFLSVAVVARSRGERLRRAGSLRVECLGGSAHTLQGDEPDAAGYETHHIVAVEQAATADKHPGLLDVCPGGVFVGHDALGLNVTVREATQAGQGGREASLLQTTAHATMIPGLNDILEIAMKLLMPPVMDPFMEKLNDHFQNTESQELAGDIDAASPVDAATMAEPQLRTNLAALIPDSVAMATRVLAPPALASSIATEAFRRVSTDVPPLAAVHMHRDLLGAIPDRLAGTLSSLLERELAVSLTPLLSLSIPRAVVPAVTAALRLSGRRIGNANQPLDLEPWCARCYFPGNTTHAPHNAQLTMPWQRCAVCTPAYRLALSRYYGVYYAQYYSLYYMRYYGVKAMLAIEDVQHSPLDAAHVKEARKENEQGRASGPSERPVTAFGSHQPIVF